MKPISWLKNIRQLLKVLRKKLNEKLGVYLEQINKLVNEVKNENALGLKSRA